jgi:hypothetical protein
VRSRTRSRPDSRRLPEPGDFRGEACANPTCSRRSGLIRALADDSSDARLDGGDTRRAGFRGAGLAERRHHPADAMRLSI